MSEQRGPARAKNFAPVKDDRHSKSGLSGAAKKDGLRGWGNLEDEARFGLEEAIYGVEQGRALDRNDPMFDRFYDDDEKQAERDSTLKNSNNEVINVSTI